MGIRVLVALALTSAVWAEEESKLVRQGEFWVQTITGSEAVASGGRIRVSTQGSMTVRGVPEAQAQYTVTKRVKARREDEARRILRQFVVRIRRQGDVTVMEIAHGGDGWNGADLKLNIPRGTREAILETHGGAVDAADLNGIVRTQTDGGPIRLDRISGPVTAQTAGGEINLGTVGSWVNLTSAGGPIRAQSIGGDAVLQTGGGDISATEVGGQLRGSTAGGAIHIGRVAGAVSVNTAGGEIEVGSAGGMVIAESGSGEIHIGAAKGVQCETGGGAVRLANVTGALHVSTPVGNVIAQLLTGGVPQESFLTTGMGDITVLIPSNIGIRILAQIESSGRIVSDFPGVSAGSGRRQRVAEGDINGGGPLLRLSTAGGTIYIRRQK